jgi:uncharacterized protein YbjQ (UPF0145 family)
VCDGCYARAQRLREAGQASSRAAEIAHEQARASRVVDLPMSTTPTLPGYRILGLSGVVSGEAVFGMNVVSDVVAGVSDRLGGRSGTVERNLASCRAEVLRQLALRADDLGGNGMVGVSLREEVITPGAGSGKMVVTTGLATAVVIVPE